MNNALSRRALLGGAAMLATAGAAPSDLPAIAEAAAIWGLPLVQIGRYKALSAQRGVGFNRFHLNRTLATPKSTLAAPNIDTIYGYGWLDLSAGPVLLRVPDAGSRYYALQFIDAYQNIISYVGHRETGTRAGLYAIAGPGWSGTLPQGARRIDSPTLLVLVLTRTLVRGDADLAAAQRFQLEYLLSPLAAYPQGWQPGIVEAEALNAFPLLDLSGDAAGYFRELDALVRLYPPRGEEIAAFEKLAPLGLGRDFAPGKTLPEAELRAALTRALALVAGTELAENNDGWRVNYRIRRFNADPLARAAINRIGPGAHAAEEALYFGAKTDASGAKLSGASRYRIVFPPGHLPPAHAFWSLILYGADLLLYENPLHRYAITDRTGDLKFDADGTLQIVIAHTPPEGSVNWLPAPSGSFSLILRTYEPDASLRSGVYRMPAITREA